VQVHVLVQVLVLVLVLVLVHVLVQVHVTRSLSAAAYPSSDCSSSLPNELGT
jgi:hypothetical protein